MAAAAAGGGSTAAQLQIEALAEQIKNGFEKVERKLDGIEERVRRLETNEAGCQPITTARLNEMQSKINTMDEEIESLRKENVSIRAENTALTHKVNTISWIGSLIGSAVILWLISQLLGLIK